MDTAHTTTTFHFDSLEAAAGGLLEVIQDARYTKTFYKFGGLTAQQVLSSGLRLSGDISEVASKVENIPGAVRYDD